MSSHNKEALQVVIALAGRHTHNHIWKPTIKFLKSRAPGSFGVFFFLLCEPDRKMLRAYFKIGVVIFLDAAVFGLRSE